MASSSITSTMQDGFQLTITAILRHGATVNGHSECVTWLGDRGRHTSYAEIAGNAGRLAAADAGPAHHRRGGHRDRPGRQGQGPHLRADVPRERLGSPVLLVHVGASLHLPGRFMSAESICGFVRAELPTLAAAVPTIWQAILQYGQATDSDLSSLRLGMSGGAAIPRSLVQAFEKQYGLRIIQGWGMTETSPVGGMPTRRRA